jgi:hypothetical protein
LINPVHAATAAAHSSERVVERGIIIIARILLASTPKTCFLSSESPLSRRNSRPPLGRLLKKCAWIPFPKEREREKREREEREREREKREREKRERERERREKERE